MAARKTSSRKTWCEKHDIPRTEKPTEPGKTWCLKCHAEQQEAYRRRMGRKPRSEMTLTPEQRVEAARERKRKYEEKRKYERLLRKIEKQLSALVAAPVPVEKKLEALKGGGTNGREFDSASH